MDEELERLVARAVSFVHKEMVCTDKEKNAWADLIENYIRAGYAYGSKTGCKPS